MDNDPEHTTKLVTNAEGHQIDALKQPPQYVVLVGSGLLHYTVCSSLWRVGCECLAGMLNSPLMFAVILSNEECRGSGSDRLKPRYLGQTSEQLRKPIVIAGFLIIFSTKYAAFWRL